LPHKADSSRNACPQAMQACAGACRKSRLADVKLKVLKNLTVINDHPMIPSHIPLKMEFNPCQPDQSKPR
jgi:hypothetical protein